jgi:hypothetical protein
LVEGKGIGGLAAATGTKYRPLDGQHRTVDVAYFHVTDLMNIVVH